MARAIMVLGTTSGAGKSWVATALCRWYARRGLKVAPFKAQNMSNNARIARSRDGSPGEIGSAQYFQALAARIDPDTRMNPVLLKPEGDCRSQVVVHGRVRDDLAALPWRERSEVLWPVARTALGELLVDNEVVIIEGAGSPAEINLRESDYVNMRTARAASAACLLVTDIDRGGAFAHLYGTCQLLAPEDRALLRGFVLNRFRGDASLLPPGPQELERLTGIPTVAVLPLWRGHGLPEEDGLFGEGPVEPRSDAIRIAVVAYPRISNLDEFQALRDSAAVSLRWVRHAHELSGADWIVLPGSKVVSEDLGWLRAQHLDAAIVEHAAAGKPLLGLCGGLQMLGEALLDPQGIDGEARGLGLLPLETTFERDKLLRQSEMVFEKLAEPWHALRQLRFEGYEIRHGRTTITAGARNVSVALRGAEGEPVGWQCGSVLGLCAHGLFQSGAALSSLFASSAPGLDAVFDGLADYIDRHFAPGVLDGLLRVPAKPS